VFHAPILETGQDNEVVFGKRVGDSGVFFHPFQRRVNLVKNNPGLRDLLRVCFPVIKRYTSSVTVFCHPLEFPGHKRKQIGTQGLCRTESNSFTSGSSWGVFCIGTLSSLYGITLQHIFFRRRIGDGFPMGGQFKRQGVGGFQVGLVKTGEQCPGPVRYQQGIKEIIVPV